MGVPIFNFYNYWHTYPMIDLIIVKAVIFNTIVSFTNVKCFRLPLMMVESNVAIVDTSSMFFHLVISSKVYG